VNDSGARTLIATVDGFESYEHAPAAQPDGPLDEQPWAPSPAGA
jgi:hypothetical protein